MGTATTYLDTDLIVRYEMDQSHVLQLVISMNGPTIGTQRAVDRSVDQVRDAVLLRRAWRNEL